MTTNKPAKAETENVSQTLANAVPDEMVEFVLTKAKANVVSGDDANVRIAMSLLNADTAEELFGEQKASKWMGGETYRIKGVRSLNPSEYEGSSLGVYAVLDAEDKDGNEKVLVTGSEQTLLAILRAEFKGLLPRVLMLSESKTRGGFWVQKPVQASFDPDEEPFG